jgi:hypothetical protein
LEVVLGLREGSNLPQKVVRFGFGRNNGRLSELYYFVTTFDVLAG